MEPNDRATPATPRSEDGIAPRITSEPASAPSGRSGFDFNHPSIISLLYLASLITGVTAIVGVVLAYVWKGDRNEAWETSHLDYLIRTFWIGLIGSVMGIVLSVILIGFLLLLAVAVLVVVRSVLSLVNAQKRIPMPNPDSWLV